MKKNQRASLFRSVHQDRITNKVSTVAKESILIAVLGYERTANRKIASLQTLVDRIGHNDRLRDLRHISSTAVIEFILLISEHLSIHIVSDVKKSPFWATWSMKPPVMGFRGFARVRANPFLECRDNQRTGSCFLL